METGEKSIGGSPLTYRTVIEERRLPFFERAAETTRCGMNVTAREGEEILVKDKNRETFHKVKVSPGSVEVAITIPLGQEKAGTTPFYKVVEELEQSPK